MHRAVVGASDSFVEKCHKWGYEATKHMTDDGDNVSIVVDEAEQAPNTKRHRLTLGKAIARSCQMK